MIVLAELSTTMWVVILAVAMLPIMSASKRRCQHRGHFPIAGLLTFLIMIGGGLVYILGARSGPPEARWAYVLESGKPRLSDHAVASLTASSPAAPDAVLKTESPDAKSDPTLEALWDRLTKSRINLDATSEEPAADPEDEKVKEAVKDTFGLDDKGKLPPKWVITPPKQVGRVYRTSVASDPWATEEECRQQLVENVLPQTVAKRIEFLAPSRVNRRVSVADPLVLGIGPDYILREICRDEFTGTVDSSVGEMKKVHVLLEFDENIDNYLVDAWLRHERQNRFASVSIIAALSLTGLAAIYGLLRFDTWSKGYYSRQLLVGGTLAIIALAVFVLRVS